MKDKRWFGAKSPTAMSVGFVQSLFGPWFGSASPEETLAHAPTGILSHLADSGAEASWTASLSRGKDLPPFLLSVDMTAGSRSAVRFGPCDSPNTADSLRPEN